MKKRFAMALCLIFVLGSLLCLSACGSKTETPSAGDTAVKQYVTGRYEIQSITWEDGTSISGALLEEQIASMGDTFVELYDDSTATLCLYGTRWDMEYSENRIWKDGNDLYSYEFFVKDGKATLDQDGTTFVFVKK